jgi:CheY-like chemotaxis protein
MLQAKRNDLVMPKTVVDCGNCGPDYNAIRQMVLGHFDAVVLQTHGLEDTLDLLAERTVDLITVNRKLDRDYSDGMVVLRGIKADPRFASIPVMLVTNYDEHQLAAIEEGAVRGFGKLSIRDAATLELLQPYLGSPKALSK